MARRNDISVDVVNKIPIREDWKNKIDQTSKNKILNNGAYYVHHDWDKNKRVRLKVAVPFPRYGHDVCGLKLFMYMFIYKILPKNRRGFEVNLDLIWLTIQVGKEKVNFNENLRGESMDKASSVISRT